LAQNKPPRFIAELEVAQGHACFSVHVSVRAASVAPEDTVSTHLLPAGDPQRAILTEAISAIRQTPEGARVELRTNSDYLTDGILRWRSGWERRNFQTAKGRPVALREATHHAHDAISVADHAPQMS
jgi:ribonuclease HI